MIAVARLPARYAAHKLIVAQRLKEGHAKIDRNQKQAEALINALVVRRPHDLRDAWREAGDRGRKWWELTTTGIGLRHEERTRLVQYLQAGEIQVAAIDHVNGSQVGQQHVECTVVV